MHMRSEISILAALVCFACGSSEPTKIRIGYAVYYEQTIVAEVYAAYLAAHGSAVGRQLAVGQRSVIAPALEAGQFDMYLEYLATYTFYQTKDRATVSADAAATFANLKTALSAKNVVTALDYAPGVDQY